MYNPGPFLISSAALTSIFSFFFGNYFKQRENIYYQWIAFIGYDTAIENQDEKKMLCAELEAKERGNDQLKGLLKILLITIIADYACFQFYSFDYIFPGSPHFKASAWSGYLWYTLIIGIIVLINCLELLYIRVTIVVNSSFPYIKLRRRITTRDRLSMLWRILDCPYLKNEEINRYRIPASFYNDLDKW